MGALRGRPGRRPRGARRDRRAPIAVVGLERDGSGWRVALDGRRDPAADGVVLALPAASGGRPRPPARRASRHAPGRDPLRVGGHGQPGRATRGRRPRPRRAAASSCPRVEGRTVTACSWTSAKWPHLAGDGTVWLRASVGRDGDDAALALPDDALVAAVLADLARH